MQTNTAWEWATRHKSAQIKKSHCASMCNATKINVTFLIVVAVWHFSLNSRKLKCSNSVTHTEHAQCAKTRIRFVHLYAQHFLFDNFCAPYLHTFTAFLIHFLFYFAFFNRKRFYINQFNLRTYELNWSWNSICPYWNEALILGNATTNDCLLVHLFDCIIAGDFYSLACTLHFTHCQDKNQVFHRFWAVFFKSGNE